MENRSLDEDLRATEAAIADWKAKVENYEGDLQGSSLRGTTRAGIRNLLDAAQTMVEETLHIKSRLHKMSGVCTKCRLLV